jgi:hypothetical protein
MELRKRDDREEPEESTESEKKKTKRGHRKKDVAKEDEKGDENSQPIANIDDEGAAESEFKWVKVTVGFGARAEKNSNGEVVLYMNPSNGAKSETHHVTVKAKVENKDMDIKSLEPIAKLALQRLKIPVVYDSKVHTIMLPDATSSHLDRAKSAPVYHMLSDIEKHWLWSGDTLTIIAVDKVINLRIDFLYFLASYYACGAPGSSSGRVPLSCVVHSCWTFALLRFPFLFALL